MNLIRDDVLQPVGDIWSSLEFRPGKIEFDSRIWMTIEDGMGLSYSNSIYSVHIWGAVQPDETGF